MQDNTAVNLQGFPEPPKLVEEFFSIKCRYEAAMKVVQAKLEILDGEFNVKYHRNPIHHIQSRLKSVPSIVRKLQLNSYPVTLQSAVDNLTDIAGIRVICSYIDDIYLVAGILKQQDNVTVMRVSDYIQNPKENGYRSYHMVISVPVYLESGKVTVPVEVQLRTIAMDFWATLEHHLRYKNISYIPQEISDELTAAAEEISHLDVTMQDIYNRVELLDHPDRIINAKEE